MRRILALICLLSLIMTALTSCKHEHLFRGEWTSDAEYHWHECANSKDCTEQLDRAEHSFAIVTGSDNVYECSVCGYRKVESASSDDPDVQKVSAEEWNRIFGSFSLTNFRIEIRITAPGYESIQNVTVTEYGYYSDDGRTKTYVVKTNGVWEGYETDDDGKFAVITTDADELQMYYAAFVDEITLSIPLAGSFDKFKYNAKDGTYTCEEVLVATSNATETIHCIYTVVTLDGGKVVSITSEYSFGEEETRRYFFTYLDIGTSEIIIPESVRNEANGTN